MRRVSLAICSALAFAAAGQAHAAAIITSASGPNAAAILPSVNGFRDSLGALNPNTPGSFGSGRREINWDGVPDAFSGNDSAFPPDFFNANLAGRARGAVFTTPGSKTIVSENAGAGPVEFGEIDPNFTSQFAVFSPQKLFGVIGSNVVDTTFFVPGGATPAYVTGFGAIFTDVDTAGATSMQFFDLAGDSLGIFLVPTGPTPAESLSFLGVRFDAGEQVGRVRIISGTSGLDTCNITGPSDCVAMDDFIYSEPQAVPEPGTWAMLLLGFGLIGAAMRRRWPLRPKIYGEPISTQGGGKS